MPKAYMTDRGAKLEMSITTFAYKAGNLYLLIRRYHNWIEILTSLRRHRAPTRFILRDGTSIDSPADNLLLQMVDEVFYERVYTPPGLGIDTNDVVVDIGANVGVFTLFAARKTQETVYACEPVPLDIEFLRRNILKNRLRNVVCVPSAVCERTGSAKLYLSEACSGTLFDHNIRGKLEQFIEVPATTLQEIMDGNGISRIGFLKLDCEGAEGLILRSIPTSYLKRIRKIAMEFHDNASALKHDDLRLTLENAGFATELKWDRQSPFGYLYGKRD